MAKEAENKSVAILGDLREAVTTITLLPAGVIGYSNGFVLDSAVMKKVLAEPYSPHTSRANLHRMAGNLVYYADALLYVYRKPLRASEWRLKEKAAQAEVVLWRRYGETKHRIDLSSPRQRACSARTIVCINSTLHCQLEVPDTYHVHFQMDMWYTPIGSAPTSDAHFQFVH